ncbi:MAG: hypothetical protein M1834_009480 [Cirrosporium novae-zelandiae]|nr:MAG: hypothetical protein M1834_009480 [Cirrosporium novae-zelandiae]
MAENDHDRSSTSSPDPLATYLEAAPIAGPSRRASTKSPVKLTPLKTRDKSETVAVKDIVFTTPSKSAAQNDKQSPPWKIHVTVSASRDNSPSKNKMSPSNRIAAHTTTTTVPLKGLDSSPSQGPKRRGRPRKSIGTPVKRDLTPVVRKRARKNTLETGENSQVTVDEATPQKRGRGRPRKSLPSADAESNDTISGTPGTAAKASAQSTKNPTKKGKARKKSRLAIEVPENEDIFYSEAQQSTSVPSPGNRSVLSDVNNTSVNSRQLQQKSTSPLDEFGGSSQKESSLDFTPAKKTPGKTPAGNLNNVQNSDLERPSTRRSSTKKARNSLLERVTDLSHFDPTNDHHEFDSILEGEGFSMVSLDTVPSVKQHLSNLEDQGTEHQAEPSQSDHDAEPTESIKKRGRPKKLSPKGTTDPTKLQPSGNYLSSSPEPSSINSTNLPFSPPIIQPRNNLPRINHTPSVNSSAVRPPSFQKKQALPDPKTTADTPKLSRIVHAGIALQRVVESPSTTELANNTPPAQTEAPRSNSESRDIKNRLDELFKGFGSGTKRESRAGLRLGEELAQQHAQQHSDSSGHEYLGPATNRNPLAQSHSSGTELPTPEASDESALTNAAGPSINPTSESQIAQDDDGAMDWQMDTPVNQTPERPQTKAPQHYGLGQKNMDQRRSQREVEWQRERNAVSQQIKSAKSDQVILVESDNDQSLEDEMDEDEEDDEDIWQQEAHDSFENDSGPVIGNVAQEEALKPRRSKIPSPWRRGQSVDYSDEPTQEASGLYWRLDQRNKQAFREREEERRRRTDFDISDLLADVQPDGISTSTPAPRKAAHMPNRSLSPVKSSFRRSESPVKDLLSTAKSVRFSQYIDEKSASERDDTMEDTTEDTFEEGMRQSVGEDELDDDFSPSGTEEEDDEDDEYVDRINNQVEESIISDDEDTIIPDQGHETKPVHALNDSLGGSMVSENESSTFPTQNDTPTPMTRPAKEMSMSRRVLQIPQAKPAAAEKLRFVSPASAPAPQQPKEPQQQIPASSPSDSQSASSSWFSYLAPSWLVPSKSSSTKPRLQPREQTKQSPPSLLPITGPWLKCHWKALDSLYQQSKISPSSFPYHNNPDGDRLLGKPITTNGFRGTVTGKELGIAMTFLDKLKHQGSDGRKGWGWGKEKEDEVAWTLEDVVKRVWCLEIGEVVRERERIEQERSMLSNDRSF